MPLRIALVNQYYAPADAPTARLLRDLAEHLATSGHEVRVVCSRRSYSDPALRFAASETRRGVQVRRTPSTGFGRGRALGRVVDYLSFLLGASVALVLGPRPDVVVSLTTPPLVAALGWGVARLRGARSAYWVMDVYPDLAVELGVLRAGSWAERVLRALSTLALRRSDLVVALGPSMAERLRAAGARDVRVIHNWADGDLIRPLPVEGHVLRATWGWTGRFVVLYSGNMGLAHEFDTLLGAAERLRHRGDLRFAFVGAGPRREQVEREARRRGLDSVEFRPWVPEPDLPQSLTAGDLHVVTLRDRVAGLLVPSKIYGILAAGRPTVYVGPDVGEVPQILRDGDCGAIVAPGDVDGLVRAIEGYADDAPRCAEAGRRARALLEARFARDAALEAFAAVLTEGGDAR